MVFEAKRDVEFEKAGKIIELFGCFHSREHLQ